jgi:hypothetical protein
MDDEELRAQLAAWLRPLGQLSVPDSSKLSRRVRRRRAGQATAGALTVACVASAALGFGLSRAPRPGHEVAGPSMRGHCVSRDLRATWLPPAGVNGMYAEAPPETYLLAVRNTGRSACVLDGWPRLIATGLVRPRKVSVTYRTHLDEWWKREFQRVVRPTRVKLRPGATALSTVTFSLPPAELNPCVKLAWRIKPPVPGSAPVRTRGDRALVCAFTSIEVSPLYPSSVPITSNYPPGPDSRGS